MKVRALLLCHAGCHSSGSGCHDVDSSTVLHWSGLAKSRNHAASPRCLRLSVVNPCRAPCPSWSSAIRAEWWLLPAACQACSIWKANPFCHQRLFSCLPRGCGRCEVSPCLFLAGFCRWSWREHRESSESWTRFWLSLKAGKRSKGKLGVLDRLVWLAVTTQRVWYLLDTER